MQELYHAMTDDPTSGYRILGYFEDFPSDRYPQEIPYLGQPNEVTVFWKNTRERSISFTVVFLLCAVRRLFPSLITAKTIWSVFLVFLMSVTI